MDLVTSDEYSKNDRAILKHAIEAGNRALLEAWKNNGQQGRRYFIHYVELSSMTFDRDLDQMIVDPIHYLAANGPEPN